jgi:tagatose-6-phosphate ketose/aldose isomerase
VTLFEASTQEQQAIGGYWTAREIIQQPRIWQEVATLVAKERTRLDSFLLPLLARPDVRIVLTGAGTSSFVGECLAPALTQHLNRRVEAIATTDLVAAPHLWLDQQTPTLLVSFARSGNSPESVAAVDVVDASVSDCWHLAVTCNGDGELHSRVTTNKHGHVLLLPADANDQGFAMTSSFTGMLLAAAFAFGLLQGDTVAKMANTGKAILPRFLPLLETLVQDGFERVVYLGSGSLKGLAHEAALKMLELTDGQVVALGDTPLGFRHGPKTILNRRSLVIVFLSGDVHARRYDLDLLRELRRDGVARVLSIAGMDDPGSAAAAGARSEATSDDLVLSGLQATAGNDIGLAPPYAMLAQALALLRSVSLGLRPDTPNAAGIVNRVVQGVTIHPLKASV